MAKRIIKNNIIKAAEDLVTSREKTRSGFIAMALEKNYLAVPYIEEAKVLKSLAGSVKKPMDLLGLNDLKSSLLTASGLSEKSLNYLTEEDKIIAIQQMIKKFLEPAGEDFIDELVYRYLLTKGDALGGKARNLAGSLGERKFLRTLLSVFNVMGINYYWKDNENDQWLEKSDSDVDIEKRMKELSWSKGKQNRVLILNANVPLVKKNVDLSIVEGTREVDKKGKKSILHEHGKYLALGELKGGIDPAGADEHWKTANSALNRIRVSFSKKRLNPATFFIGAAIEHSMAEEIFRHLTDGTLTKAANLTDDNQLSQICEWIVNI